MVTKGLWVRLVAKPGMADAVENFLRQGAALAQQEPETRTWYAVQLDGQTFGIFDTFDTDAGRQAHLSGPIAAALMANADTLLAQAPEIHYTDVLAVK